MDLIDDIRKDYSNGNSQSFNNLYHELSSRSLPSLIKLCGSEKKAKELFNEAMGYFFENLILSDRSHNINDVHAYFYTICKNVFFTWSKTDNLREIRTSMIPKTLVEQPFEKNDSVNPSFAKQKALSLAIDSLTGICRELFILQYERKVKLINHWKALGFTSYNALTKRNYKCKAQLKKKTLAYYHELKGH